MLAADPAAAEDALAIVEDAGLAGCDPVDRALELGLAAACRVENKPCRHRRLRRAQLDGDGKPLLRPRVHPLPAQPVDRGDADAPPCESCAPPDHRAANLPLE